MKKYIIDAHADAVLINAIMDSNVSHPIDLGFVKLTNMAGWLDENCPGWDYHGTDYTGSGLTFSFKDDADFIAFKLMWG